MLYIKQKPAKNAGFKHLLQFDFGNSSRHLTMFEVGVFLLGLLDKKLEECQCILPEKMIFILILNR
jgi:hypothetical protein